MLLSALSGCVDFSQAAPGTVSANVVVDETAVGNLFTDQTLRATATVQAGHVYRLAAKLTVEVGSIGSGGIEGTVTGAPLADAVAFTVATTGDGALADEPGTTFVAQSDGQVVMTFDFPTGDEGSAVSDTLISIRQLINGPIRGIYSLLLSDHGIDDNGTSTDDAVPLPTTAGGELTGTLGPGDEADYFLLDVVAGATYQFSLEATGSVNLTLGSEDRFGQINFGVASPGGLSLSAAASAGVADSGQFTAPATESVFLRLSPTVAPASDDNTIQYALSVVEVLP